MVVLIAALPPVRRLVTELPAGQARNRWKLLAGVVLLLILGYAVYVAAFWSSHGAPANLLVPALFLVGAFFVRLAAAMAHATLVNVRRMPALDRADITDALTGLHNRQYLDSRMREEMLRAERHSLAVSVLLLDIDDFGSINSTYGHAVGDQVLTEIGRILSGSVRESDVLVRCGGEEMALLATHTPPDAAMGLAERLRRDIEVGARKALREAQGARRAITVSVGVAGRDAGKRPAQDLFALAEQALAKAKSKGGNCVVPGQG